MPKIPEKPHGPVAPSPARADAPRDIYSISEVARITGIPHRTLDYWATRGILKPSIRDASGAGTCRIYSFEDLVVVLAANSPMFTDAAIRKLVVEGVRAYQALGFLKYTAARIRVSPLIEVIIDLGAIAASLQPAISGVRRPRQGPQDGVEASSSTGGGQ